MCFVNKMDRIGANFYRTVDMVKTRLQAVPAILHLPVGSGGPESNKPFAGLIDLVKMKALIWRVEELGAKWDEVDIPADQVDEANEYREALLETIATSDDEVMEKYLAGESLTEAEIKRAIRKGTLAFDFVPILCGSAFKNKGVQPMLDAVIDFLPSPLDIPPTEGVKPNHEDEVLVRKASESEPFSALAFKIVADRSASSPTSVCTRARSTRVKRSTTPPRSARSASCASCSCTPTSVKTSTWPWPATSLPVSASRTPPRATPCAIATTRSSSSA
jgi:elongation factor G